MLKRKVKKNVNTRKTNRKELLLLDVKTKFGCLPADN